MSTPFVKIDLHGMTESEAIKVIDQAIAKASLSFIEFSDREQGDDEDE